MASNRVVITTTVAAVEIGFGIVEGIVLPNIMERQKGQKFFLPSRSKVIKTGVTLLTTGVISGFLSEWVLRTYPKTENYRVLTIAAVSIAINMFEPIIVENVSGDKGLLNTGNFRIPPLKQWISGFGFLTVTALMGGYASDRIIAGIIPKADNAPVLEPEPQLAKI